MSSKEYVDNDDHYDDDDEDEDEIINFRIDTVPASVVGDVLRSRKGWREIHDTTDYDDIDFNW